MDAHDNLCIHSQSVYVLVIASVLLCTASSRLPHNVLHSPSSLALRRLAIIVRTQRAVAVLTDIQNM